MRLTAARRSAVSVDLTWSQMMPVEGKDPHLWRLFNSAETEFLRAGARVYWHREGDQLTLTVSRDIVAGGPQGQVHLDAFRAMPQEVRDFALATIARSCFERLPPA